MMRALSLRSIVTAILARIGSRASVAILAVTLAVVSYFSGAYTRVEGCLTDFRDSQVSIPSSQSVVLVGLDQTTFDALGGLPLRRSHYARVLELLAEAGAKRIYVDVFFQAASNAEDDKLLENVIDRIGPKLALPQARIGSQSGSLSQPIGRFSQISRLVAADMQLDNSYRVIAQGRDATDETPAPSVASWLVRGERAQPGLTNIDVRIDLDSIPRISFMDVLNGNEQESLRDRLVIVGITAQNVLQPLIAPKYGALERADLLALAAETELQSQKSQNLSWGLQFAGWLALSFGLAHFVGWVKPLPGCIGTAAIMAAILGGAIHLQANYATTFNVAIPLVTSILTFAGVSIAEKPAFGNLKTLFQSLVRRVDLSLARLFNSSTDAIVTFSPDGKILAFNEAAEKMLGVPAESAKGRNLHDVLPGSAERLIESMQRSQPGRFETTFDGKKGRSRHVDLAFNAMPSDEGWIGYASLRDITDLKEREINLERQARVDSLTGLPNRMAFEQSLRQFADSNSSFTVMLLDLNRFKQVNDTLGHAIGDELLKEVTARFKDVAGGQGEVFRLGGDEFTIVLSSTERNAVESLANQLVDAIASLNKIGDHHIDCGTSIGIAMYPAAASELDSIVEKADQAMYEAKRSGSGYQFATTPTILPAIAVNIPDTNATESV